MNRTEVLQEIIDATLAQSYLEVGAASGANFWPIRAQLKIGVDPALPPRTVRERVAPILKSMLGRRQSLTKYHKCTSDEFFRRSPHLSVDVVFIDGLHTYGQSLSDVLNSLRLLGDTGVIVLHDCSPPNEAAAHPGTSVAQIAALSLPGWTGDWCGDVWKTICYLRSQRRDLRVFVLNCDCGLGIVTRGEATSRLDLSEDAIADMTFGDLARNRERFLNLKEPEYLREFLASVLPSLRKTGRPGCPMSQPC